MRRFATIALAAFALAGCEANGPRVQLVHPQGAGDLARIAPECLHPTSAQYAACVKAAEILEKTPEDATDSYLRNWNHVVWDDRHVREPVDPAAALLVPLEVAPPVDKPTAVADAALGGAVLIAAIGQAAYNDAHHARVVWAETITTRALEEVYREGGDAYSREMLAALRFVRFDSGECLDAFAAADERTREHVGSGSGDSNDHPRQPDEDEVARANAQLAPPRGLNPVPIQTRDGWTVVECGEVVEIATRAGNSYLGQIAALNPRALLLQTRDGEIVLAVDDVWVVRK